MCNLFRISFQTNAETSFRPRKIYAFDRAEGERTPLVYSSHRHVFKNLLRQSMNQMESSNRAHRQFQRTRNIGVFSWWLATARPSAVNEAPRPYIVSLHRCRENRHGSMDSVS